MTYLGLFSCHQPLRGKDWIRRLPAEDRAVFVSIGLEEAGHGQKGGRAVYTKRGSDHMKQIGRIGAVMSNIRQEWNRAVKREAEQEFGIILDY